MSTIGIVLMIVGAIGVFVGMFATHWVRHISSLSLWLSVFAAILLAGLALQAASEGWDITR